MNIQNISALVGQLKSLGFENASSSLLKRICFKPDNFILSQKIEKGKDHLSFHLFFEKSSKQNGYVLVYYDAILQKEIVLPDTTINGIGIASLEKRIAEIDWQNSFDFDAIKQWSVEDKASWDKEQRIKCVIESLSELECNVEGKAIAEEMKIKYWAGIPIQELINNAGTLKNKSGISQRFYFFEGQAGISVDEAYRFLQNRRLEKQMLVKRKQTDDAEINAFESDGQASSGNGLLKKKRLGRSKTIKSNKSVQR